MLSQWYRRLKTIAGRRGFHGRAVGRLVLLAEGIRLWRKDGSRDGLRGVLSWIRRRMRAGGGGRRPDFDRRDVPMLQRWDASSPHRPGSPNQTAFSILMPVYNTNPADLREAVGSVLAQWDCCWELCIVDDGSDRLETRDVLDGLSDFRIRIDRQTHRSGIAGATNKAFRLARHDWIALLDHDDRLHPGALTAMVRAIASHPDADVFYSDEDKIDPAGCHHAVFHKPDFSPDLLRSQNYVCHFLVIRRSAVEAVGGWREGFDGAQDHDLLLRLMQAGCRFHHVPHVLYSWRQSSTSTALSPHAKPDAHMAGMRCVDEHARACFGPQAHAEETGLTFVYRVRTGLVHQDTRISIVIPTRDHLKELRTCVDSIRTRSTWTGYDILVIDNGSTNPETLEWLRVQEAQDPRGFRSIRIDAPFNWSRLNNIGIRETRGDILVLLNNDTEVITPDWLERLAEDALRSDVGAVGGLLVYPDGRIQHAGVVVGMGGWADHVFKGHWPVHDISPFVSPMVKRNVLAVSGACMAVSRRTIDRIGGFDERYIMCGSDVEFCLRVHAAGLWNVYDPGVRLIHHEAATRRTRPIPEIDFDLSREAYAPFLTGRGDPFYNPHLSLMDTTPMVDA